MHTSWHYMLPSFRLSSPLFLANYQPKQSLRYFLGCFCGIALSLSTATAQDITNTEALAQQVRQAENAPLPDARAIMRRHTFLLEERSLGGAVQSRASVVWQRNIKTGSQAQLFYDEGNLLQAGEWRFADGTRKSYWREPPAASLVPARANPDDTSPAPLNQTTVWLYAPNSDLFTALAQMARQTVIQASESGYTVDLRTEPAQARGIIRAKLSVRRSDWRVTTAAFIVEQPESIVEYQFTEAAEIVPAQPAPPSVVEWETALAAPPVVAIAPPALVASASPAANATPLAPNASSTTNAPSPVTKSIVIVGSLINKATARTMPTYPVLARRTRAKGTVTVHLEVDEQGKVAKIIKVVGPAQLQETAETAARSWRFAPTIMDGQPVRVTGYISFEFNPLR